MKNIEDQHTRKITHGVCTFTPEKGANAHLIVLRR